MLCRRDHHTLITVPLAALEATLEAVRLTAGELVECTMRKQVLGFEADIHNDLLPDRATRFVQDLKKARLFAWDHRRACIDDAAGNGVKPCNFVNHSLPRRILAHRLSRLLVMTGDRHPIARRQVAS